MQEIVISSVEEAEEVRRALKKLLDTYEQVPMADYLELVGLASSFSDQKMGWTDLGDIPIKKVQDGFVLELPEPKKLGELQSAFPFLKGWWVLVNVPDDQKYEGTLVDYIGDTMIIEIEPSKIRLGVPLSKVNKFDAYRERPETTHYPTQ